MNTEIFPWGKIRALCGADNSAVLVVRNVKVRIEAQHSIPPLSLHDLLTKRVEITLDWRKFIKTIFMNSNTSRQKNFTVIISRIMRWGRRGSCSTYGEKTNTYNVLVQER